MSCPGRVHRLDEFVSVVRGELRIWVGKQVDGSGNVGSRVS